jgi:hypothetical protein
MQTSRKLILAIFAVAICGMLGAPTDAQRPAKSGKYIGKFAAHLPGGVEQSYELEKGHVFIVGPAHGVFLNDVAGGFLDKTEVVCPRVLDVVNGLIVAMHGYCTMTDKDGDKVFLVWEGKDTAPGTGGGTFKWTGGTGKFSGLQGNNNWHGTGIGKTPSFVVVWEGDWRLP